jgi:ribosomal protein L22
MSTEDEQEETPVEPPAEASEPTAEAAKKPARARKAAAKAKEPAVEEPKEEEPKAEEPKAEKHAAEEPATEKPKAKKPTARKPAAKAAGTKVAERDGDAAEKEQPATPARRTGAAPAPRRQVVRARARYVRTSARKARMVCGHLRGKSVPEARAILAFTPREAARSWSKLLESAVANAENNHELLEDDLIVGEAFADEGPTIKRFQPRAMGRATPIRKRTSHLTITLTPRP